MLPARPTARALVLAFFLLAALGGTPSAASARTGAPETPPFEDVTVFVAKQIVTMEPGLPEATAARD